MRFCLAELFLTLLLVSVGDATKGIGHFLVDSVAFGDLKDGVDVHGQRQGYAVKSENLEEVELALAAIPDDASLSDDGVEVANLKGLLMEMGVNETCNVSLHETRMAIGRAMLKFLERRFGRRIIHLGDTSRVSGGAIYGEATVRDTRSKTLRNAHHVFHVDKYWPGLSKLLGVGREEAIAASVHAHWPFIGEDLARQGLGHSDYTRLAGAQNPGMLNFWVSLTPGKLVQQPLALLLKDQAGASPVTKAEQVEEAVSSMHVYINSFNDSITMLRSRVAADASARWGFRPGMAFGEALLFPTDRTAHSAVWLPDGPADAARISAEIRVLVTEEAVPRLEGFCDGADCPNEAEEGALASDRNVFLLQMPVVTEDHQHCLAAKLLIPPAVLALLGTIVLFAVFRSILDASLDANDPRKFALSLGVYLNLQENMIFTILLVNGLDFMLSLRSGCVFSGALIGIHKMGTSLGTVALSLGLRAEPDLWRHSRPILLLGAGQQIIAALAFSILGFVAMERSHEKRPMEVVFVLLFVARFVQGFGGGLQISLAWNQAAQLTSGSARGSQNMLLFLGGCLGLGAGPLLVSVAGWAASAIPCSANPTFMGMLPLVAVLPLMQLAVLLPLEMPSLQGVSNVGEHSSTNSSSRGCWRIAVVLMCLCMLMLRNLALAALEAGVSAILQTEYGWSKRMVGLGTSGIVFGALPAQLLYQRLKLLMTPEAWTAVMLWTSFVAASFLSVREEKVLIAASTIFFAMMALGSGLIMAKMQDHALPPGSILDLNTAPLLGLVIADFAGRGGGPIIARWSTSRLGQAGFAWLQVVACGATVSLYYVTSCGSRCHHREPEPKLPCELELCRECTESSTSSAADLSHEGPECPGCEQCRGFLLQYKSRLLAACS